MTEPATGMAGLLQTLSDVFTAMLTHMGATITFLMDNPILLIFVILSLIGFIIGAVRRWLP